MNINSLCGVISFLGSFPFGFSHIKLQEQKKAKTPSPVLWVPCHVLFLQVSLQKSGIEIPNHVQVAIEVPKGSFVKRRPNGSIDFAFPSPCPFNYGSVTSIQASDGDPLDAIVLGDSLPYGHIGTWRVKGKLKFIDAGIVDDKLVCVQPQHCYGSSCFNKLIEMDLLNGSSFREVKYQGRTRGSYSEELSISDWLLLTFIFNAYAPFKGWVNATRKKHGMTSFNGWEFYD